MAGVFRTARDARRETEVVVVQVEAGGVVGRGECVPYARYGETTSSVLASIEAASRGDSLTAGAAREAWEAAHLDLEARRTGVPVFERLGLPRPEPVQTAWSLGIDAPEAVAAKARERRSWGTLKVKVDGESALAVVQAVRAAAPDSRLIVDANEGFSPDAWRQVAPRLAALGVSLVEQPLKVGDDAVLREVRPVPVCADESVHTAKDVPGLRDRYDAVNIKLGKTGGLREGLRLAAAARAAGMQVMVGCQVCTSLGLAPAVLVAQGAEWVDLDGPLLLARDREGGLRYEGDRVFPAEAGFWGG